LKRPDLISSSELACREMLRTYLGDSISSSELTLVPFSPLAGSGDIVDGNLKLILGLIWTLILHYQISIGFGLDDQPKGGPTPKQALLDYINVSVTVVIYLNSNSAYS
jgi:hypothetical protein